MLGHKFLIVGHTASGGRRDFNLTLSQRRADVIRDVLVNTFKVSSKRLRDPRPWRGAVAGPRSSARADQQRSSIVMTSGKLL